MINAAGGRYVFFDAGYAGRLKQAILKIELFLAWWQVLSDTYTICSVTRYTGEPYGRILQGSQENWLHGQSKKNTGVSCAAQDW